MTAIPARFLCDSLTILSPLTPCSYFLTQVRKVLKRLIDTGLQVDINKFDFHTKKTKYLGLIITPGGLEMDPEKFEAVRT